MILYYMMVHKNLEMSVGAFMAFMTAFGSFSSAMMQVVSSYLEVNAVGPAFERMKPILDTLPEQQEDAGMPGDLTGDIEVNNVTFSYDEDSPPALKDLSLHIKSGEYVGIVGSSGCGKSTLLKLLLGFEKPQSGRIYYDGRDLSSLDLKSLRRNIGAVMQNGKLFQGDIYSNIVISAPWLSVDEAWEAAEIAGIAEDIRSMPMGMNTVISEGTGGISGGQRQRQQQPEQQSANFSFLHFSFSSFVFLFLRKFRFYIGQFFQEL